jgi:hypothetical protein
MTRNEDARSLARSYLLQQMPLESREQFETKLFENERLFAEVLGFEDELMDDYASNKLDPKTRALFEAIYLQTHAGRKHYQLHRRLSKRSRRFKPTLNARKTGRSVAMIVAATTVAASLYGVTLLYIERIELKQEITHLRMAHDRAVTSVNNRREATHITTDAKTVDLDKTKFVPLNPHHFRNDHGPNLQTVLVNKNINVIVLLLEPALENPQKSRFIATLNTPEGNHLYQSDTLTAEPSTTEQHFVYFAVPASKLPPADYIVVLSEVGEGEKVDSPAGEFAFRISTRPE